MKSPANCGTYVLCVCLGILSFTSQTLALTCVDCTDVKIDIIGVSAIPGIRSKSCSSATLESDIKKTVCPANPNGGRDKVYKCGKTSGKLSVHTTFTGKVVSGQFVDRKCVLVKKTTPDGCKEETTISGFVGVLSKVIEVISVVGSVSYEGSRCVTSSATKPTSSAFNLIGTFSFLLLLSHFMK